MSAQSEVLYAMRMLIVKTPKAPTSVSAEVVMQGMARAAVVCHVL